MSDVTATTGSRDHLFGGFESLDANFIYCPNQFFDYALRHSKRSTIRLVAHVMYSTLRWRDENANPINTSIAVPHRDLQSKVKISKGSFDEARTQSLNLHLIEEVVKPQSKAKRQDAVTGCYALKWDEGEEYRTNLGEFAGLYAREGNRTAVPGEFFTDIIPAETLTVIKVVGAVIRHTIGYESQFGRREVAELSLSRLQDYTGITNRTRLVEAITRAIEQGYIVRESSGVSVKVSPNPESATYSINWLQKAKTAAVGSKKVPDGSEMVPGERSKNGTSESVQKGDQGQYKKGTSVGSITGPGNRYKKGTNIKQSFKVENKQQDVVVVLMKKGISKRIAEQIVSSKSSEVIQRQIDWLPYRDAALSTPGMLIQAIKEDWSEPSQLRSENQRRQTEAAQQEKQSSTKKRESTEAALLDAKGEERQQALRDQKFLISS